MGQTGIRPHKYPTGRTARRSTIHVAQQALQNTLLVHLEERYSDVKIGSIKVQHITVADDLAVLSRDQGSQQVKDWDVDNNTRKERYCVNTSKSTTLLYHFARGW